MRVASDFRELARRALSGKWGSAVLTTLVASILGADIMVNGGSSTSGITNSVTNVVKRGNGDGSSYDGILASMSITSMTYILGAVMAVVSILIIVGLVQYVIGSFVSLGLIQYNLDLIDGKDVEFGQIFSKASMFGKAFWLRLRMGIFTFLWTLLFIIPGIIKSYAYSMSGFILAENPEMTAKEAMQVSEEMMAGNKWRLFCLQFSFIGWQILCILSLGIGSLWLTPYMNAATAAFYDEISREPLN
nr:DUF975 family protein [uncultured Anaerobutyricum sp.]